MTTWANESDVAAAIARWNERQIECRTYGHNWRSLTVYHRPGAFTITQRCARCRNERARDIDEAGAILNSWRMQYRQGYLLTGIGRIGVQGRNMLRLASLVGLRIIEVEEDDS